jgi:hypothetical protein
MTSSSADISKLVRALFQESNVKEFLNNWKRQISHSFFRKLILRKEAQTEFVRGPIIAQILIESNIANGPNRV